MFSDSAHIKAGDLLGERVAPNELPARLDQISHQTNDDQTLLRRRAVITGFAAGGWRLKALMLKRWDQIVDKILPTKRRLKLQENQALRA